MTCMLPWTSLVLSMTLMFSYITINDFLWFPCILYGGKSGTILWMHFCLQRSKNNFCLKNSDHYIVYIPLFCDLNRWFLYGRLDHWFFLDSTFFSTSGKKESFWFRPIKVINITEKHFVPYLDQFLKSQRNPVILRKRCNFAAKSGNRRFFSARRW